MDRRSSIDSFIKNFEDTLGYGTGDLVTYAPTGYKVMGIVIDIDPKIRKVFVDWAGSGSIHQHDPEDLQIAQLQEKKVRDEMAMRQASRIASKIAGIVGNVSTTEFLTPETEDLLNKQFANELANSAFYRCCASNFEKAGLPGFRAYFLRQGDGEAEHAMKVYTFLVDSGVTVKFPAIQDQPIPEGGAEIVKAALVKETQTTKNWQIISESAQKGHNVAVVELCQFFMKEQMEEESSLSTLLNKVMKVPLSGGLEVIDEMLRTQDPTPPIKVASFERR